MDFWIWVYYYDIVFIVVRVLRVKYGGILVCIFVRKCGDLCGFSIIYENCCEEWYKWKE